MGGRRKKEGTTGSGAPINLCTQPGAPIISDLHLHNKTRSPTHSHPRNRLSFFLVITGLLSENGTGRAKGGFFFSFRAFFFFFSFYRDYRELPHLCKND